MIKKKKIDVKVLETEIRDYQRAYYIANREELLRKQKIYRSTTKGKLVNAKKTAKWNDRNRDRYRAHHRVSDAKRRHGMKKQPCEICGDSNVDAHHEDYSKPLEIRWLCRKHHVETHGNNI